MLENLDAHRAPTPQIASEKCLQFLSGAIRV